MTHYKMAADFRFPEALTSGSLLIPFMGLTGLDTTHNAVHRTIWEVFKDSRKDGKHKIHYKTFPLDHIYPKPSRDFVRMNYESYIPVGILKKAWIDKHTQEVPSVLVVFYELDWDDPDWDAKKLECQSRVEVVRSGLQGRSTFLVVVLLQSIAQKSGAATQEEIQRVSDLYRTCKLVKGQLFVLSVPGRLETTAKYVAHLEDEYLLVKARKYYDNLIKKVKGHEDLLVFPQHHLLLIRYHFKTAFLYELRQEKEDTLRALEDYRKCYQLILDVAHTLLDHLLEFKVVGGLCSFKICQILFRAGDVDGAILQFRRHTDAFRSQVGPKHLAYEHMSWMAKQYSGFADLLASVVGRYAANQRSHPGVYYHKAAYYATERQRLCHHLCAKAAHMFANALKPLPEPDYYGQRPWRMGLADKHPSSPEVEHEDVGLMQAHEYQVEHPWQIIPLLSLASEHYKKYQSTRTGVYLKVKMAEQYYQLGEYDKCLVYLHSAAQVYRQESWLDLLSSVLQLMLRCAYLLGGVDHYVTVSSELIAASVPLLADDKLRIQNNLFKILKGGVPEPESGCNIEALRSAVDHWSAIQDSQELQNMTVSASDIHCFVECRGGFVTNPTGDGTVCLKVTLQSTAPQSMLFSYVMVHFSHPEYDQFCVTDVDNKIELVPKETQCFEFAFLPLAGHVWQTLEISSIDLICWSPKGGSSLKVFKWSGVGSEVDPLLGGGSPIGNSVGGEALAQTLQLKPRPAKLRLALEHSEAVLVGEVLPLVISMSNEEEGELSEVQLMFAVLSGQRQEEEQTAMVYSSLPSDLNSQTDDAQTSLQMSLDPIVAGEKVEQTVYLRCSSAGPRELFVRVLYKTALASSGLDPPQSCASMKEEHLGLLVVEPFSFEYSLKNMKMEKIEDITSDEPFLLVSTVHSSSPLPLQIVSLKYKQPGDVEDVGGIPSILSGQVLYQEGDTGHDCLCLKVPRSQGDPLTAISLGSMEITWRRESQPNHLPVVTVSQLLPTVPVQNLPFVFEPVVPASGQVNSLMVISFVIHNKSEIVQDFEIKMIQDDDTHFLAAGNQMHHFRVLPSGTYTLNYNLVPLQAGRITLPIFHISYCREPQAYDALLRHKIPTHVEIMPITRHQQTLIELA